MSADAQLETYEVIGALPVRDAATRESVEPGGTVQLDPARTPIHVLLGSGAIKPVDEQPADPFPASPAEPEPAAEPFIPDKSDADRSRALIDVAAEWYGAEPATTTEPDQKEPAGEATPADAAKTAARRKREQATPAPEVPVAEGGQ